ncbi:hypothetical protein BYT27DRAFT_6672931 [Phlegmacium glaucopus]|nr:hypothetical protein BYT27DRAFT_6672931 [Phlegmacium glaucopus]
MSLHSLVPQQRIVIILVLLVHHSQCLNSLDMINQAFKISEPTGHPILINWFSFCKATNCWVCTAFAIILEYSFHLWDPAPSSNIKYLTSAIDVYKSSGKHVTVTAAVENIFEEEKGLLFGEVEDIENSGKSTFAQKLIQIALENRLHLK